MIIALTGAGISKSSGIPTFEEASDLRGKLDRVYAMRHKKDYERVIQSLKNVNMISRPNDAHLALAEYDIPVITMNIDSLHTEAGSKHIIPLHGQLIEDNVVLYGDPAPNYTIAMDWVDRFNPNDILLIIGTSFYTGIATTLKVLAETHGATVEIINDDAEHKVRQFLEEHKDCREDFDFFIQRPLPYDFYV